MDGGSIGQILGGQIGGRSSELSHKGWLWPFMQTQIQPALTESEKNMLTKKRPNRKLNEKMRRLSIAITPIYSKSENITFSALSFSICA